METPRENSLADILDQLDSLMDRIYFVPLSIYDTLAVQFRAPVLKNLPLETIRAVYGLIDDLEYEPPPGEDPDPDSAAAVFFSRLQQDLPELYELWSGGGQDLVLDPVRALNQAAAQAEKVINHWVDAGPENISPGTLEKIRDQGMAALMDGFDPLAIPDDRALRNHLREKHLPSYPAWARPGIYLDCWLEFIRAVMDLHPRPETRRNWPF